MDKILHIKVSKDKFFKLNKMKADIEAETWTDFIDKILEKHEEEKHEKTNAD